MNLCVGTDSIVRYLFVSIDLLVVIIMIITICSSQATDCFIDEIKKAKALLSGRGHTVYVPDSFEPDSLVTEKYYAANFGRDQLLKMKPVWIANHGKKINESDAVLVMNHEKNGVDGYIGSSTLMELAIALYLGKQIYLLNEISEGHPHFEELAGLDATVLNGDLTRI